MSILSDSVQRIATFVGESRPRPPPNDHQRVLPPLFFSRENFVFENENWSGLMSEGEGGGGEEKILSKNNIVPPSTCCFCYWGGIGGR